MKRCRFEGTIPGEDLRRRLISNAGKQMKTALLMITFLTPGGGETHWSETTGAIAACHTRALELAEWAASQGVRIHYQCQRDSTAAALTK